MQNFLTEQQIQQSYPLVYAVNSPDELKKLSIEQLPQYCNELRNFLIHTIGHNSGHFASNLGTVELTVALHYVYNSPDDKLIWDVGHQAYAHKIITGRRQQIHTIRKTNGLHPFPARKESTHDILTVGHSSTSISAAVGIAYHHQLNNSNNQVLAIIGDGAITGGMAFEAMNHGGSLDLPMAIVFNDNNMSISENVGALNKFNQPLKNGLSKITSSNLYKDLVDNIDLHNLPPTVKNILLNADTGIKSFLSNNTSHYSNLFQTLGFNYIGPLDGHDVIELIQVFTNYRFIKKPTIFHIITTKGKGYSPAEEDPITYHGVNSFLNQNSTISKTDPTQQSFTYSEIFGQWLCSRAKDKRLIAITPAMREGSGMVEFSQRFPQQYLDVAISEQHAVTLAAGLAIAGLKPVVAIYSTFLQRGYDQLIHDIAIDSLDVVFAVDRAGLVGADGQTHQGSFDLSYLRPIPNIVITVPANGDETISALDFAFAYSGPVIVRYPRDNTLLNSSLPLLANTPWQIGKGVQLLKLSNPHYKIAILNFSTLLNLAHNLADHYQASLYNMRFVKPLDLDIIAQVKDYDLIVTMEENTIVSGAGSATLEVINQLKGKAIIKMVGIPDQFIPHGDVKQIKQLAGWDFQQLTIAIDQLLQEI